MMLIRSGFLLAALFVAACASGARVIEAGNPVIALTDVTIISAYGGERLSGHTIAVRGDRIIAVAPDERLVLPQDARRIDGAGRFVAPGLADMHAHYSDPQVGGLFLANSVTTVRNPSGGAAAASVIAAIAAGDRDGPRMYASGLLIDGPGSFWGEQVVETTVEGVRERVRADAEAGFVAVKLYSRLTPEQFRAGVDEARAHDLQVYAHVPTSMTLHEVLALGVDSIEHFEGFDLVLGEGQWFGQRWANAAPARYAPLAADVNASGVWNTPTLIVNLAPARAFADLDAAEAAPEMRYLNAELAGFWQSHARFYPAGTDFAERYRGVQQGHANRIAMLSALREAGASVLVGTDAPNPFVMYGFAIHEELSFFREAGYTNAQTLRIATLEAARFLGAEGEFGVLLEGARADFVLLDRDPETDPDVFRSPEGVMAAGRWYDRDGLDGLLESAAAHAAASHASASASR